MKKLAIILLLVVIFGASVPVFAQISKDKESEYFYVNVPLEKIYPYRAGYVLVYRKGVNKMVQTYVPGNWFYDAGGKAELITLPPGRNWPSLSVYYKEGEFSHIRLYIHRSKAHATWGNIPQNVNIDDRFEGIESIELEF